MATVLTITWRWRVIVSVASLLLGLGLYIGIDEVGRHSLARALGDARAAGLALAEVWDREGDIAPDRCRLYLSCSEPPVGPIRTWLDSVDAMRFLNDLPLCGSVRLTRPHLRLPMEWRKACEAFVDHNVQSLAELQSRVDGGFAVVRTSTQELSTTTCRTWLADMRLALRSAAVAALLAADEADPDRASTWLHTAGRIRTALASVARELDLNAAVGIDTEFCTVAECVLALCPLDSDILSSLEDAAADVQGSYSIAEVVRRALMDRASLAASVRRQLLTGGWKDGAVPCYGLTPGWADFDLAGIVRTCVEDAAAAQLSPASALQWCQQRERISPAPPSLRPLARVATLTPVSSRITACMNLTEKWRAARTAIAAERFRRLAGRWPNNVAELAAWLPGDVPIDAYSERPLLYRTSEHGVAVWSVGANLQDDSSEWTSDRAIVTDDVTFEMLLRGVDPLPRPQGSVIGEPRTQ